MTPAEAYWLVAKYVNGHLINDVKTYVHKDGTFIWLCEDGIPAVNVTDLLFGDLEINDPLSMTPDEHDKMLFSKIRHNL